VHDSVESPTNDSELDYNHVPVRTVARLHCVKVPAKAEPEPDPYIQPCDGESAQ
jgi:hypothetical protein